MTKKKNRGLTPTFMKALKTGVLKPILDLVKADNTLDLQIRADYINIYYRGGNLLRVVRDGSRYEGEFDLAGYSQMSKDKPSGRSEDSNGNGKKPKMFSFGLSSLGDVMLWTDQAPRFKHILDLYIKRHPNEEREAQQLIVRENNYGRVSGSTDYFICDIEYVDYLPISKTKSGRPKSFRTDLIAVHWPSADGKRDGASKVELSFIELKYGDGALVGTAGINKHLKDLEEFLNEPNSLKSVLRQMRKSLRQKIDLDLVPGLTGKTGSFRTKKPDYIFILGNHNPKDGALLKILKSHPVTTTYKKFKLKFAVSNFMGFGLYDQCIYSLNDFREKFEKGIFSK